MLSDRDPDPDADAGPDPGSGGAPFESLREIERAHIQRVLDGVAWNKTRAAQVLEIGRETLYRKIAEFGLTPSRLATAFSNFAQGVPFSRLSIYDKNG